MCENDCSTSEPTTRFAHAMRSALSVTYHVHQFSSARSPSMARAGEQPWQAFHFREAAKSNYSRTWNHSLLSGRKPDGEVPR